MELLQTLTKLNNTDEYCPYKIGKCELLFNSEKLRVVLRLGITPTCDTPNETLVDICCYDKHGEKLTIMTDIPYIEGGMLAELPSLMTANAAIIVRRVVLQDGTVWKSDSEFPEKYEPDLSAAYADTAQIDSSEIKTAVAEKPSKKAKKAKKEAAPLTEEEEIREFIKNDPTERRKRRIARLITFAVIAAVIIGGFFALRYNSEASAVCRKALNLYNSGKFEDATAEFDKTDAYIYFGDTKKELDWCRAMNYCQNRDFANGVKYFKKLGNYKTSIENTRSIINAYSGVIAAGKAHTVALKSDGSVLATGENKYGQCDVSKFYDIMKVSAGGNHTVVLHRSNKVFSIGDNSCGQCNTSEWEDVCDISTGTSHTVAAKKDGSVVACGDNTYGQCDVSGWLDIISIKAGVTHTVGLRADGSVIASGNNKNGECNVSDWQNVIQVAAGEGFTAALTSDGKILFTGDDSRRISDAKRTRNVMSIAAGSYNLIVTNTDGKTVAFGGNDRNQSMTDLWSNIVAVSAGEHHSVGISDSGTAIASGDNDSGQISLSEWNDIGLPKKTVTLKKGE